MSVIIPCRNGAATLDATLRSLFRQSCRRWEAIVIDDGSTDRSVDIVRRWSRRGPRVRSASSAGVGVAGARNLGLEAARAPWLLFLDCDDWLHADALGHLLRIAGAAPGAGVVAGEVVKVAPDGRRQRLPHLDLSDPFDALCCEGRIAIHSALVRTELVRGLGGFDTGLRTSEDWDLWQRLARSGVRFQQTPRVVAYYRNTPGSLSKDPLQVARDGLAVMRRGHGPDPRVTAPAPALAAGAPRDSLPSRSLYFTLWCAARQVALGADGRDVTALLETGSCEAEPTSLGRLMASGMADVLARPEPGLAPRWPEFEPRLRALLTIFGPERTRLQLLTLAEIKARLNGGAADPDRLHLDRPAPAAGGEVVQLSRRGRSLGAVALPTLAPRGGASLAAAAAAQARRLPLRNAVLAGGAYLSPVFWRVALLGFCRRLLGSAPGLEPRFVRAALRAAVRDGLAALVRQGLAPRGPTDPTCHEAAVQALWETACARAQAMERGDPPALRCVSRGAVAPAPRPGAGDLSVPVLMYHRVADIPHADLQRYAVTPSMLWAQLRRLRQLGYSTVTPADVVRFLRFEAGLPPRPVLLTFDDGYRDFHDHAWPLLARYAMTATVYAVTGRVGEAAVWDAAAGEPAPLMDWRQLRELSDRGIAVESHGHTHRHMTRLPVRELYAEALQSRACLQTKLGQAPVSFCYPYGAHDAAVVRAVEESGYGLAFTTEGGACDLNADPLRAPRIEISGADDLEAFTRKLQKRI